METWQLDGERDEGGAGDWQGLGDGLRDGESSICGVRIWLLGEWGPPEDANVEASRRLRANNALLALAELFWVESLEVIGKDELPSDSPSWCAGWTFSLLVSEPSAAVDRLSLLCPSYLSLVFGSPWSPLFPAPEHWWPFCWFGWHDEILQTLRTEKKVYFKLILYLNFFQIFLTLVRQNIKNFISNLTCRCQHVESLWKLIFQFPTKLYIHSRLQRLQCIFWVTCKTVTIT